MTPHPGAGGQGRNESLVRCEILGQPYAFDSVDVRLIVRSDRISPAVDRTGARVGVVHGPDPIPVYSLPVLLGLPGSAARAEHVIVTAAGDRLAAWQVDRVVRGSREVVPQRLPLPELAGPRSRRWFKALLSDGVQCSLLCSPGGLDPDGRASAGDLGPLPANVWSNPAAAGGAVAMFSSRALPACGVSRYALSARRVLAVAHAVHVRAVPGTPTHVVGLAAWMGFAVPVLDFSVRGTSAASLPSGRFLVVQAVVGSRTCPVAIAIERDVLLHRATPGDRCVLHHGRPLPAGLQVFEVNGEPVALLDVDALVANRVASAPADRREPDAVAVCAGEPQPVA